jgi:hypothetical protein
MCDLKGLTSGACRCWLACFLRIVRLRIREVCCHSSGKSFRRRILAVAVLYVIQRSRRGGISYKKFCTRFCVIDDVDIVQDTRFDDTHAINAPEGVCLQSVRNGNGMLLGHLPPYLLEVSTDQFIRVSCQSLPEQSCTTVSTEVACDFLARVCDLADCFGCSTQDFELLARDNEVVRIVAAGNFTAIRAVAESLAFQSFVLLGHTQMETYHHSGLSSVLHLDLPTEAASGRHVDG